MSARHLLTPGKEATVPFPQDYLFSRWVSKGSRLLLTVNVNKNAFAEINYGTGRDVGTEDIHDAGTPMKVDWLTSSYIRLRIHAQGGAGTDMAQAAGTFRDSKSLSAATIGR